MASGDSKTLSHGAFFVCTSNDYFFLSRLVCSSCTVTIGALLYFLPSLVCEIFSWDAKTEDQYNNAVLVSGIPYIFAVGFLIWCCRHSDRSGDRFFHVTFPCALAGICLILLAAIDRNLPRPVALVRANASFRVFVLFVGFFSFYAEWYAVLFSCYSHPHPYLSVRLRRSS